MSLEFDFLSAPNPRVLLLMLWGCDITVGKGAYYSMVLTLIQENSKNVKQLETWCSHNNLAAAAHKRHCLQDILRYNDCRALFRFRFSVWHKRSEVQAHHDCKWSKSNPKKSKWDSINSALDALIMNTLNHIRGRSEKSECLVCGFWLWPVLLWSITNAFLWSLNCKLGQSETKPMIDRILFENILVGVLRCLFCRSKVCKYHQLASMLTQMASWQPEYLFSFLQSDFSPFHDLSFRKIWLD